MDLHVHSCASARAAHPLLAGLPESWSEPERLYDLARRRGMDAVALTDHDTIDGALELVERGFPDVIVGEEVTTRFADDGCVMHVLVWGISPE
ncbi:MAG: PHP domain-containing protein, partial [Planctomycetota bacterium]